MFFILLVGVLTLLIYFIMKPFTYWIGKNVPTTKVIPIFGDFYRSFMGTETIADMILRIHNSLPDARYIGIYMFHVPVLFLKSTDVLKEVLVGESDSFYDHGHITIDSDDELWNRSLFSLCGENWKNWRTAMTPLVTGSKIKTIYPLIWQNMEKLVQRFKEKNQEIYEVEFKEPFLRMFNDMVSATALGIDVDSFKNETNDIYVIGTVACDLALPWKKFVLFVYLLFPKIARFFKLSIFHKNTKDFFVQLIKDTIKMRRENNIVRNDMIGILMEMREEQMKQNNIDRERGEEISEVKQIKESMTDLDIASQVFIAYFGFLDPAPTLVGFISYELAISPEIQKKLLAEIDQKREKGIPDFDTLMNNMPYLDMVFKETLRKWPPVLSTDRICTKPYTIEPKLPNEKPVHLDVGDNIFVPIYSFHRDPKYFPDPEKFDPERFSPENKDKMDPSSYIPFGLGRRACFGTRFALTCMKVTIFQLLSHFEIVPTKDTMIPLRLCKNALSLYPENGFRLGLKRRTT